MTLEVKHTNPRYLTGIFFTGLFLSFFLLSCSEQRSSDNLIDIQGEAQGTYYSVKYIADSPLVSKQDLDQLFASIDSSLSTYKDYSLINRLNDQDSVIVTDEMMLEMIRESDRVYKQSEGAFDPTVMPLVKAWGFGPEGHEYVAEMPIDSILNKVGWNKLILIESDSGMMLVKSIADMQLDFNAIAQGYASDIIADHLEAKGIYNYLIDTGGELRARGTNQKGNVWTIGIDSPQDDQSERTLIASFELKDKSVATSGNYRKFYVKDGVKYAHTISPFTGRPAKHTLLSATVVTDTCSLADAYATALMVMGTEKAISFIENDPRIEGYLVYSNAQGQFETYKSKGLEGIIKERE
jgi:thiamine biosynthesis lipoprotein